MSQATEYWTDRYGDAGKGEAWLDLYWESWRRPYRLEIVEALRALAPLSTLMELGAHCGPNLRLIREAFPGASLCGVDVSAEAVRYGTLRFDGDPNVALIENSIERAVKDSRGWDALLTCYSLAYVEPMDLKLVLSRMLCAARKGIVLAEPMVVLGCGCGAAKLNDIPEYRHDYDGTLRALGVASDRMTVREIDAPDNLNAILTILL